MAYTFKPQADSEYLCDSAYCGIVFKSFASASKLLNAYNVIVDNYELCVKCSFDGYHCFSYKLRPIEDLTKVVKNCELLLFKPKTAIKEDNDCDGCFYFISQDTLDELPIRELEDIKYV